mmetsp:Transcript_4252/g.11007  ORF Transcript_4252/g.11007 Transcript_4252/m.11007 type:complete len:278 (-) Transcript_4252:244-1077(-)
MLFCSQLDGRDKVQPGALWRLVQRAVVQPRPRLRVDRVGPLVDAEHGADMDDRELRVEHLRVGVDEALFPLVPFAPVEEEAVDVHALLGSSPQLVLVVFENLRVVDHVVERPVLLGVPPTHLLPIGCEEALRVEEAREPEGQRAVAVQPVGQLLVARKDVHPPQSNVGHHELRDLLPELGHPGHEERVEHLRKLGRHDDGACNRELEVDKHPTNDGDDLLQPVDLLREADVERAAHAAYRLDLLVHLVAHEVGRQLQLQVLRLLEDDLLAGEATAAA